MSDASENSAKRERSPSFPYIGLDKAVERTRQFAAQARRSDVLVADAAGTWGMAPKSSSTLMTIGALLAFGLIEDSGAGDSRKIRVSDVGQRILGDERPGVREKLLAEAALKPKLIAEYALRWADGRPADQICISELKYDKGFNDEGASRFLRVFDETIVFARSGDAELSADGDREVLGAAREQPREAESNPPAQVINADAIRPMLAGEREWLRGPLSRETSYRLLIQGEMGPREIGKLIRLLQAQQAVLSEEDELPGLE